MATDIVMPRLSDTMDTGTIAKWLKHEGDHIKRGDVIAEIETDKANMELESYSNGILAQISVQEGQSAGVGEPIAVVAESEDEAKQLSAAPSRPETPAQASHDQAPPEGVGPPADPQVGRAEPEERIKASPLARRLAQEHGISLREVGGTGPGGRITKEDVQSYLRQVAPVGQTQQTPTQAPPEAPPPQPRPVQPQPRVQPSGPGRAPQPVEMTRMRETIARRMTEARFSAPDFLLTSEIDMTDAMALLRQIADIDGAPRVGPNDLLIKACAVALRRHPDANAGWEDNRAVRYGNINIGFAVAVSGGGLVVPVVRNADGKTLGEIAGEAKGLRDRARDNKLAPADYSDGTFTISNLGMYGIDQFTSILNPPEACSLAVGSIERKPVVSGDDLIIRDRLRVTLTCDHRVINGAEGAEFLQTLRRILEHPVLIAL